MRVTSFDLECSNLNADFGLVLCASFMDWREGKRNRRDIKTLRIDDYPIYKREKWNDKKLVCDIRDYLEGTDVIVSWNGRRFDVPYLNGRLMYWGEKTLQPVKHCDVMYQARYKMKLHSSRLASVQSFLNLSDEKTEMKPQMWMRAVTGDRASMDYIIDHCERDVLVLDQAYTRLKHFVSVIYK